MADIFGYVTQDDALMLSDSLPPDSSAVLVLIENSWAEQMVNVITEARGEVLISERIPRAVIDDFIRLH